MISEEGRKKISEASKRAWAENPNVRKIHTSSEIGRKISDAKRGKYKGKNNPFFGREHTDESRRKMSEVRMGIPGPVISEEGKRSISEKVKEIWKRPGRMRIHLNRFEGSNHPNWKGKGGYGERWTNRYQRSLRKRLGNICQSPICKKNCKRTHLHHVDFGKTDHSYDNIILVCTGCHMKIHRGVLRVFKKNGRLTWEHLIILKVWQPISNRTRKPVQDKVWEAMPK